MQHPSISGVFERELYKIYSADHTFHRLPWKPVALVYPEDVHGVAAAIKCGSASGVKVNARSGGHSCQYAR